MIEAENLIAPWQWVSFADDTGFKGVAIVRAWTVGHAAKVCHELGINPGGSVMATPIPEVFGDPPVEWDHRLIADRATVNRLTWQWHGCEIVRVP